MKRVGKIFDAMDWFLACRRSNAGLGAIGIINIMLVSVTERTKRLACARRWRNLSAILTQFFVEGAFLTAFSGGIGLAIATGFVTLLAMLPAPKALTRPASSRPQPLQPSAR